MMKEASFYVCEGTQCKTLTSLSYETSIVVSKVYESVGNLASLSWVNAKWQKKSLQILNNSTCLGPNSDSALKPLDTFSQKAINVASTFDIIEHMLLCSVIS